MACSMTTLTTVIQWSSTESVSQILILLLLELNVGNKRFSESDTIVFLLVLNVTEPYLFILAESTLFKGL
ncbi:hypothetical protein Tco_1091034 [Tanacetum coccineum]|uniref:Uncharacterized protein n=1 Tax=Tanacetum coccineum TaxID=301880 RepID=A0ABQ5I6Z9_9ASTR